MWDVGCQPAGVSPGLWEGIALSWLARAVQARGFPTSFKSLQVLHLSVWMQEPWNGSGTSGEGLKEWFRWPQLLSQIVESLFLHVLISVQDLKGLGYEKGKPVGLVGVTELSEAQKKQLKEQQEVMPWRYFQNRSCTCTLCCSVAELDGKMEEKIAREVFCGPQINL